MTVSFTMGFRMGGLVNTGARTLRSYPSWSLVTSDDGYNGWIRRGCVLRGFHDTGKPKLSPRHRICTSTFYDEKYRAHILGILHK